MDSTMPFEIDEEIKQQMPAVCLEFGMTASAASLVSVEQMMKDTEQILGDFADDYARMTE